MDIKYIKVGKWYNVPFKVVEIKSGDIHMENGGIKAVCQPSELSEITSVERTERLWNGMCDVLFDDNGQKYAADLPKAMQNHIKSTLPDTENGIKNTETAPKYDPTRKFRKGDKVRVVERNGRIPICFPIGRITVGDIVTIAENETGDVFIKVLTKDGHEMMAPWFMLELVTPVEELEPYFISEGAGIIELYKGTTDEVVKAWFYDAVKAGVEALAEAEAERDRLNAEHRKEQG